MGDVVARKPVRPPTVRVGSPAGQTAAGLQAVRIQVEDVNFFYGTNQVLHAISMKIPTQAVTALIGPSGCGKSTFLRLLNRMNDLVPHSRVEGKILLDGRDIRAKETDVIDLRRRVGMVFQRSTPFPKSVFDNIAYALRIIGIKSPGALSERVERSLRQAALWDEVKDRLSEPATRLSGGQQQRLCIARALALDPEVLLMDEPCSALDPTATGRIEELVMDLKKNYTIVIVTHNMQQAARVSDETGFLLNGKLIEFGPTDKLFTKPDNPLTESYITGRFG